MHPFELIRFCQDMRARLPGLLGNDYIATSRRLFRNSLVGRALALSELSEAQRPQEREKPARPKPHLRLIKS
jgi:hypothetical protein